MLRNGIKFFLELSVFCKVHWFINVDKSIKTTHLQSIFKYAKNLRGGDRLFTMQKKSLIFVARDWIHVESDNGSHQNFAYGTDGGNFILRL